MRLFAPHMLMVTGLMVGTCLYQGRAATAEVARVHKADVVVYEGDIQSYIGGNAYGIAQCRRHRT